MLSYLQSLAIILVSVVVALVFTLVVNRTMQEQLRERSNLVNSSQLIIIGTIYGVLLGFMLSDAWIAYQKADDDVRSEAAAALTIYRSSSLLPAACAVPLQNAAEAYAKTVITVEWPSMEQHQADFQGTPILAEMWRIVNSCSKDGSWSETARENIIGSLANLQSYREARLEDYDGHLPVMMWSVLLFGAAAVILASTLLGNENKYIHALHIASLTILISVSLLTISDLDRPFDGGTRVEATAFRTVVADIERHSGS